jgi:hypothetical protein
MAKIKDPTIYRKGLALVIRAFGGETCLACFRPALVKNFGTTYRFGAVV